MMTTFIVLLGTVGLAMATWRFVVGKEVLVLRILAALVPLSTAGAVLTALALIVQTTDMQWSDAKLAPIVAMTKGYDLYQDPNTGVMTAWMYGPVGAIALLPAALAKDPTTARIVGNSLCVAYYFLPAAWILILAGRRSIAGQYRWPLISAAILFFAWLTMNMESLGRCAYLASADAPALGLAACSIAWIYDRRNLTTMTLSAVSAVLCIWTKQNFLTLLPALVLCVMIIEGRKAAMIYTGILLGVFVIVSAMFLLFFGASNMYFQMVWIPSHHPANNALLGPLVVWSWGIRDLILTIILSIGLLMFVLILDGALMPSSQGLRQWCASRRWASLLIIALFLIPSSMAGYMKAGGNLNNLGCTHYFLWLAALAAILELAGRAASDRLSINLSQAAAATLTILGLLVGILTMLHPTHAVAKTWPTLLHPYSNTTEVAFRYVKDHPGQAYLPWDPLITLLAEGKLYHFEWGLVDRLMAKRPPSPDLYRAHLPPNMTMLLYAAKSNSSSVTHDVLPQFNREIELPELPSCIIYVQ